MQNIQKLTTATFTSNTCSAWIEKVNTLKAEYINYFENGVSSTYIDEKLKKYTEKMDVDKANELLKKQMIELKDFDLSTIEGHPLFLTGCSGVVAIYCCHNGYKTIKDVSKVNFENDFVYERIVYDYARPYFDLDFNTKDIQSFEDVKNSIDCVYEIINTIQQVAECEVFGIAEYRKDIFEETFKEDSQQLLDYLDNGDIKTFENVEEKFKKLLSIHIYTNGVCFDRTTLTYFIKDFLIYFEECGRKPKGFDDSVYKVNGQQQVFRVPYCGKFSEDGNHRKANRNILNFMNKNKQNRNQILLNCVVCPKSTDVLIEYKYEEKQTKQKKFKNVDGEQQEQTRVSIFKFIKRDDKIIESITLRELNHFEFGQHFAFYLSLPLTQDEFKDEILYVKPDLDLNKFFSKFTYKQDFTTLHKLKYLKSFTNKKIEELRKIKEPTEQEQDLLSECLQVCYLLENYVLKYEKQDFVRHEFYNINEVKTNTNCKVLTKKEKILFNMFKIVGTDQVFYHNGETLKTYDNKNGVKNEFRLSGESANDIYESLVCFEDVKEFNLMRLEATNTTTDCSDLLNMLRQTFENEDDYKYYLSWLAQKVTYKTSNGRGIICQSLNSSSANSLKTFITQLLANFIEVYTADVRNLNKALNGTYLKGCLTVVEELPKKIEDIDSLINTFKMNSSLRTLTVEEKGKNAVRVQNNTDFIINTNHSAQAFFFNINDAEPMAKRFRILLRKSINVKEFSNVLDKYGREDKDLSNSFVFYKYLNNNQELLDYFKEHHQDHSEIEKLYLSSACEDSETDKIPTNKTKEQFVEYFKSTFVDNKNRLKLKALLDEFKKQRLFKDMKQKTFKQSLVCGGCAHIEKTPKDDARLKCSIDEINKIYETYYEYIEEEREEDF